MPASSNAPASSKSRARSFVLTLDFFKKQLWVWPLIAALLLVVIGVWARGKVDEAIQVKLAAELETIRNSQVAGLESWLVEQKKNVASAARSNDVQRLVGELLEAADKPDVTPLELAAAPAAKELDVELIPWLKEFGYSGWGVCDVNQRIVAATAKELIGKQRLPGYSEFLPKVLAGTPVVSHPFRSVTVLTDETGQTAAGLPTMYTVAPVRDAQGKVIAALGFRLLPNVDFTRILSVARGGKTGETFAFNRQGLLLGGSRFDDELKRIGLLPDTADSRSILTLELRDPGVDLTKGLHPTVRRSEMPLTRAVADAVEGHSGVDVMGYRDYRGVPVVAAWAWLPDYDFGIVTKIDRDEAYAPLYILRPIFWGLFGLLTASALAIFVFTVFVARLRQMAKREALKARQLGQYALDEKIGQGAMGVVYRGHHAMLQRPTAIKLIDVDKTTDLSIARFEREVRLTSQLSHPNTICIYDFGRTPEGIFYYAMELLDGINLDKLVRGSGPLPEGRVIHLLTQLCGSLHEAHGLGLIHRDIKPANIMLCRLGGMYDVIKLLDFGLVKAVDAGAEASLTAANAITGTPLYMPPEAVMNTDAVDARSDLYSLGAVGYFLLTGKTVFTGASLMEICRKQIDAAPEPPSARLGRSVDTDLEALIMRCLAKLPSERPAGAEELAESLGQCTAAGTWTAADARRWWEGHSDTHAGENVPPSTIASGLGKTVLGPVSTG
jgi:hypothetical protein